jgi:hypothetical protein
MNDQADPCSDLPLALLLSDDHDGDDELRSVADHLGHCEKCQSRLAALAADDSWWSDARQSLSGTEEFAWMPDLSAVTQASSDRLPPSAELESSVKKLLSAPSHPELLGRLGRYDIERVIGSGGMGVVLKAHDSELNRPVAIKVLAAHLAHVGAARERFAREGRAAAAVVHEHVVAIHNVETEGTVPFLVMQYVAGESLQARVDAEGPLAVEKILRIGIQSASGLAAAHAQGLVHRDVKPSNILLEESVERAVLTDFGLARAIDDASLTHTGVLAGTPHYMSPEQAHGELIDHRSDLFSLGAVLYFMATGHPPFRADGALAVLHRICRDRHRPVWQTNDDVPDELSDLIDALLEKKPARRPASAQQVAERLSKQLSALQRRGLRRRAGGWRRVQRRRAWALATVTALAAALGVAATVSRPGSPPEPAAVTQEFAAKPMSDTEQQNVAAARVDDTTWFAELGALDQELNRLEAEQGLSQPTSP